MIYNISITDKAVNYIKEKNLTDISIFIKIVNCGWATVNELSYSFTEPLKKSQYEKITTNGINVWIDKNSITFKDVEIKLRSFLFFKNIIVNRKY